MQLIERAIEHAGGILNFEGSAIDKSFKSEEWEIGWTYRMAKNMHDIESMPVQLVVYFKFKGAVSYTYGICERKELQEFVKFVNQTDAKIREVEFMLEDSSRDRGKGILLNENQ
jgi:hypothetical protein